MNEEEKKAIDNLINILAIHHISSKPVQQLLDLYNKQKEEKAKLLDLYNDRVQEILELEQNSISKDKIREKINFLESQFDEEIEDYNNQFIIDCVGILEELLEEK